MAQCPADKKGTDPFEKGGIRRLLAHKKEKYFVDVDFAPVPNNIADATDTGDAVEAAAKAARFTWARPADFLKNKGELHVFESGLNPGDVQQGELGDCW